MAHLHKWAAAAVN